MNKRYVIENYNALYRSCPIDVRRNMRHYLTIKQEEAIQIERKRLLKKTFDLPDITDFGNWLIKEIKKNDGK